MIVAIIQARMGSSRFPGKTLADLCGRPMLWQVFHRVNAARLLDKVVVATSDIRGDDPIAEFCDRENIPYFRGSEDDVLDRYFNAAKQFSADSIVRVTADCPLIDSQVIDRVVARFLAGDCDYVSNTLRYTFPDGLDTEVFSFEALRSAWVEASKPAEREHVTPFLRTSRFRVANVESPTPVTPGTQRWTVDHQSDLDFVRAVYHQFANVENFGVKEILELLDHRPDLANMQSKTISNHGYYKTIYEQALAGPAARLTLTQSEASLARAKRVIPSAAQTFSKKYTQYPKGAAPAVLQRGKGARVWDVDGNEYIDYVQGLLPNILGYAHPDVNQAVAAQMSEGHSFSLPHPLEITLAERLCELIPCAEMVRFGKNGSDATSGAVRAARAYTGRDRIACCGYHGWQDWYIGSTTRNAGVPEAVRELTHPFRYNDLPGLEKLFSEHPQQFAAVIMEPINFEEPLPGFLEAVKELAREHGAVLIFDEICCGFHFGLGGAQKLFGVTPDLACFGKAMGNGFPISCVVGKSAIMPVFDEIFFSFTFAGEVTSIAAAMKVLDILDETDALAVLEASGRTLQDGVNALAKEAGIESRIQCLGRPQWSLMKFREQSGGESPLLKNLFQQEAIRRGVLLLSTHNMTASHDHAIVHQTLEVYAEVMKTLSGWLSDPNPARFLEGELSQPVFKVR